MHRSKRIGIAVVGSDQVLVVDIPDVAGRNITKNELAAQSRDRFSAIDIAARDGVPSVLEVAILHYRITRDDIAVCVLSNLPGNTVASQPPSALVTRSEPLAATPPRLTVV